jgi:4a-hydroxytetrahydrobiopterin dehydratase
MPPRQRLSAQEVDAFLKAHSGWRLEQGELRRTFELGSFAESMRLVGEVAALAEREDHHPDIDIRYKRVTLALITYDRDGLTGRDTELAALIDELWTRFSSRRG